MEVEINGEAIDLRIEKEISVEELLDELATSKDRVAFALNGNILPVEKYKETTIKNGDKVEIIQLMAGG